MSRRRALLPLFAPLPIRWRAPLALLLALALTSCAQRPLQSPADWEAHRAELEARPRWELQGKIGVRAKESGSALLSWRQQDANYRLVLSGALGLGKLVLEGDPAGVRWTGRDGVRRSHPDPAALIRELWGWEVPVGSLSWWVRGLPDPALPLAGPRYQNGLATQFSQAGWTVEPQEYRPVDGLALPTRVRLRGAGAVLTVAINRWSLGAQ